MIKVILGTTEEGNTCKEGYLAPRPYSVPFLSLILEQARRLVGKESAVWDDAVWDDSLLNRDKSTMLKGSYLGDFICCGRCHGNHRSDPGQPW
jgi:hypothetical protein